MAKKIKNSKPRVVAYVRVSTAQQADFGSSLEAQCSKMEQYAALHELEIVATEVDAGASASTLDRPALQRAFARLDAFEADGLLVTKLDRLTRSVRDLATLVETRFQDSALISIGESVDTSSATGRMLMNVLMSVSQWEREAAAERTAAVMAHLRASGKYTGGWPPFGFRIDEEGNLVEVIEEQALIVQAKSLRAAGHPLRAIACALGNNPRTGGPFHTTQIVRML